MNFENESWKDVVGYEGYYQVSNMGNIKSIERWVNANGGKRLSPSKNINIHTNRRGYATVCLCKDGVQKTCRVNVVVAKAFLPNPLNKKTVNHKNGVKNDNRVSELEWNTHSENVKHAYKYGLRASLRGEYNGRSKMTDEDAIDAIIKYQRGEITQRDICLKYGLTQSTVSEMVNRKTWKHLVINN